MNQSPINILQITDTHLFADRKKTLLGCNTDESLTKVIQQIKQDPELADMILFTGDASQDYSDESYQHLLAHFKVFTCPIYYIPGNHDERTAMNEILGASFLEQKKQIDYKNWRIILLDSLVPKKVHGHLDQDQLDFLAHAMKTDKHLLITLHHHPVPLSTGWLDPLGVDNAADFITQVELNQNTQVILWGHIHQEFTLKKNGVLYLATPSTCIQFKPGVRDFALDDISPGYRWLKLYPNGFVKTHVRRTKGYKPDYDLDSPGY